MLEEAGRDHGPFRMVLNRDHGCFGVKRAVIAFDEDAIGEFQRVVNRKQDFARCAELDDGILKKDVVAVSSAGTVSVDIILAVALGAAEFDGDPHRRGFRKEPGQPVYDF